MWRKVSIASDAKARTSWVVSEYTRKERGERKEDWANSLFGRFVIGNLHRQLTPSEIREAEASALAFPQTLSDVPGRGFAPGGRGTEAETTTFQEGGVIPIGGGVPKDRTPVGDGLFQYWKGGLPHLAKSCVSVVSGSHGWQGPRTCFKRLALVAPKTKRYIHRWVNASDLSTRIRRAGPSWPKWRGMCSFRVVRRTRFP